MQNEKETGNGQDHGGANDFEQLLQDSFDSQVKLSVGEKVHARVFKIGKEYIFLDLGAREEGILPRSEVEENGEVTVAEGDTITVYTVKFRDGAMLCGLRVGAPGTSDMPGDKEVAMATIRDAYENGLPIEGTVKEVVKGGFSVHIMSIRAFCPISQISNQYCAEPEEHLGHVYGFLIIELDGSGRNIVLSRRRLLEAEAEEMAKVTWEQLQIGEVREGTVSNIMSYGAFIEVGGVEGLLHVSEIDYDRVDDPHDHLTVGQKLQVQIKGIDQEKKRISLSRKALLDDPWLEAARAIKEGEIMEGTVARLERFGAFVELRKGVEGLVHISEMGAGRRLRSPHEVVRTGDKVTVKVLKFEDERRRISLSMDEAQKDSDESMPTREEMPRGPKPNRSLGTFGDLFAEKLKK